MTVAIIPARGGSKRIPRKNIKPFLGKPIIAYSIDVARESQCFDRIVVTTDDDEIADVARAFGADVPFKRPAELSDDQTGTIPVIAHAISWLAEAGEIHEEACCIYATAPFIQADDLRRGRDILRFEKCDYVLAVTSFPFPIQRAVRITASGRMEMFHPEHFNTRSQDLDEAFHDAGQFCWGRSAAWLEGKHVFTPETTPLILPRQQVQDIDTPEDWDRAELMFSAFRKSTDGHASSNSQHETSPNQGSHVKDGKYE